LSKKLLKIFEEIFAQRQSLKVTATKKGSATVVNVEEHNENIEVIQPRATIIHPTDTIISENTLSYEDQNFSYNIDLITPDNTYDTPYESQDEIHQDQYMPFLQEDPNHNIQNIFIPVSFPDQLSRTVEQVSTILLSSLVPIPKDQLINMTQKYGTEQIPELSYNTDGLYLQPNNPNLEYPEILDFMSSSCTGSKRPYIKANAGHMTQELNSLKTFRKIPKKIPRFRENNNWVRKEFVYQVPPEDRTCKYNDYKSSKEITLIDRNFCKKKNRIRDYINPVKGKSREIPKLTDLYDKPSRETKNTLESGQEMIHSNKSQMVDQGSHHLKLLIIEPHGEKRTQSNIKCSKTKPHYFEEPKYQMDEKIIESYFKNQSKLKVVNKWKLNAELNLYDKSNDKYHRRQNKIRTSLVDLPNVLKSAECKLFCPKEVKCSLRKKKRSLSKLTTISSITAWQALMPLSLQTKKPVSLPIEEPNAVQASKIVSLEVAKQVLTKSGKQVFIKDTKQVAFPGVNKSFIKSKKTVSIIDAKHIPLQAEDLKSPPEDDLNQISTPSHQSKVKIINVILDSIISHVVNKNYICQ